MSARKSILVLTISALSLYATQASAFFGLKDDRAPPKGLNGPTYNGVTDQSLAAEVKNAAESTMVKNVVFPDGSRIELK